MSQPPYPQQHDPGSQNPGNQYPGYPTPGGQQPAGQYPGGQYPGYQNAPAPPSGYGYGASGGGMPPPPAGWGGQAPQQTVARPPTVTYALAALVANMVLGVLAAVLIFANQDAYLDQAFRDAGIDPANADVASDILNAGYRIGAIVGLFFVALWALFLWFAWKGHNWARIVIWVLGGLSLFGIFTAFSSPVAFVVVLNVLSLLLTVTAVVLLALKPSNEWYSYQGNARTYGWPGRA
ncbi:MAG: hypothetical protein H0U15_08170 [Geodermatophilaceae bacterium]|nr:hypothetical protein [Geodermatophilaceae bacterium]